MEQNRDYARDLERISAKINKLNIELRANWKESKFAYSRIQAHTKDDDKWGRMFYDGALLRVEELSERRQQIFFTLKNLNSLAAFLIIEMHQDIFGSAGILEYDGTIGDTTIGIEDSSNINIG